MNSHSPRIRAMMVICAMPFLAAAQASARVITEMPDAAAEAAAPDPFTRTLRDPTALPAAAQIRSLPETPGQVLERLVIPATLEVKVSVAEQRMEVWYQGEMLHEWKVSTAKSGKITPRGSWSPQFLSRNHRSSLYNNAPMPFAIFYDGNYAIHGTDQVSRLGRPASNGCVRLHPDNARILFDLVRAEGMAQTRVTILN